MKVVVVFEPAVEVREHRYGTGTRIAADVIPLKRFDERFRHAVGFRAANRREARRETDLLSEEQCFHRCEAAAVIRKPLNRVRRSVGAEPPLDRNEHHVADHLARDAAGTCCPRDDLTIAGIHRERDANNLAVPAVDFEAVRTPARIGS